MFVLIPKCSIRDGVSRLPGQDLKKIAIELEVRPQQPADDGLGDPKTSTVPERTHGPFCKLGERNS